MKKKIPFWQLMQYADPETEPEIRIQIVVDDEEDESPFGVMQTGVQTPGLVL